MRKTNLAVLAVLVISVAAAVGTVVWARDTGNSGPGDNAHYVKLTVEGSAAKGAAVTLIEDTGRRSLLGSDATLPFHKSWPRDGSSSYQLQAQPLGTGSISCRIALGSVVEVHHASGEHTCTVGVEENTRSPGWSTY